MAVAVLFAILAGAFLLLMLARYAKHPALLRAELEDRRRTGPDKPPVSPLRLLALTTELLPKLGLHVEDVEPLERDGSTRLTALGKGVMRDARHVIYLEPRPPGSRVGPEVLLELAEDVASTGALVGILISPGHIDGAVVSGLDVELELVDGLAFASLIHQHLPHHAAEIDSYQLTGTISEPVEPPPIAPPPIPERA